MTIKLCEGDIIPENGKLVIDLKDARVYHDSDGATIIECGDCGMIAKPRGENLNAAEEWFVDDDGILTRK